MDNEEVAVEKKRPGMPDYMSVPEPVIRASHFEEDRLKLHPDLQPWLQMDGYFGPQLKHPLTFQIMGVLWKMANDVYEYKTAALAKAIEARDWHQALFLHERPWRLTMLDQWNEAGLLTIDDLRDTLPEVWTDAEYPSQHGRQMLMRLFRKAGFICDAYDPMNDGDERAVYPKVEDVLPPMVTIYRGTGSNDKPGISWTTDLHTGAWFARRFREDDAEHRLAKTKGTGSPKLLRGVVKRKDVLGYFKNRSESEIVVDPRKVLDVVAIPLPPVEETVKALRFAPPLVVPAMSDDAMVEYRASDAAK